MSKKSKEFGIYPVPTINRTTLAQLERHMWPGNVRELENAVERALIQHRHGPLSFDQIIQGPQNTYPNLSQGAPTGPTNLDDVIRSHIERVLNDCGGKVNGADGAAAALEINPNTLRNRMRKLGIVFGRKKN
jgi:DNA-binding NtrC family response regulator